MDNNWKLLVLGTALGVGIYAIRRKMAGGVCKSSRLLTGKTVIVTGANSGIGKETAMELARRQARVIMACRNVKAGLQVADYIKNKHKNVNICVKELDLASFSSIRTFAQDVQDNEERLDILINNAGVYQCPFTKTADDLETQIGVNHFGHFLLTNLLLSKLKNTPSPPARVVVVSSGLSKLGKIEFDNLNSQISYDKAAAYNNSKLANNYFSKALSKKVAANEVCVYCLKPGMVLSNLGRHKQIPLLLKVVLYPLAWLLVKNCWEGCQTVVYCAVAEELEGKTGKFYADCHEEPWNEASNDLDVEEKLWQESCRITGLGSS